MKVLIVEDNPITALDLQDILVLKGISAKVANSYSEAITLFNEFKPDIALVDVNLGEESDGIDFVNQINGIERIPVVYLTGNSDELTRLRALKSGASSFLTKPFRDVELTSALEIAFTNGLIEPQNSSGPLKKYTFLKSGKTNDFIKVKFDSILYLKAEGSYTLIKTLDDEFLLSYNLNQIMEKLASHDIIRVHRSWCVNMSFVDSISHDYVLLTGLKIPIGRKYRDLINALVNKVG